MSRLIGQGTEPYDILPEELDLQLGTPRSSGVDPRNYYSDQHSNWLLNHRSRHQSDPTTYGTIPGSFERQQVFDIERGNGEEGNMGRTQSIITQQRLRLQRESSEEHAMNELAESPLEDRLEPGVDGKFVAGDMPIVTGLEGERESLEPRRSRHTLDSAILEDDDIDGHSPNRTGNSPTDPPDNSPYPQVRASVNATDDITLSINTPRMWILSLLFAFLGSATNLFFSLRYPSVSITPVIALLLVHPLGRLWDRLLKRSNDPTETFVDGTLDHRAPTLFSTNDIVSSTVDDSADAPLRRSSRVTKRRRLRLWLSQGRWNQKEHACVYISSNVSFGFAFATDVIVEQKMFYYQEVTILYQILLILSTQILGYAFAGITRRYLVRPSGMIWPATLISTSMFSTLHNEENKPANGWRISRWKFFLYVFLGSFVYYFLPGLLIPAFTYFNVITWFAPDNVVIANLFGTASGLGLFPMTLDWSQITYIGSPLVVPFWAAMNVVGGLVIVMWIIAPIMYYKNVFYSAYMPILSSAVFDNTGKPYNVSKILTPEFLFDEEAYKNYSRVFLPITYVLSYAVQFAALTALITHTACWHGKDIWKQWRRSMAESRTVESATPKYEDASSTDNLLLNSNSNNSKKLATKLSGTFRSDTSRTNLGNHRNPSRPDLERMMGQEDVHNRLMRRYSDVPLWWYLSTGAVTLAVGMFVVEYYPVYLPWYGLLLAFGICAILFIPIGIVMAITSQQSSIYLVCQMACGAIFPGRPVANMVFTTFSYISSTQGMKFSSDLKLGHYMKVPPKILFAVQMVATVVSSLTQIGVLNWMLANVPGICTPEAVNGFICPLARVHFNGSILWGVVGPGRFFGDGGIYQPLVWAFLVGAISPIIVWQLGKRRKDSFWRMVNLPVLFGSLSWIPPATGLNFSVWALVCLVFNRVVRIRKEAWWKKYNMTLSAALDAGLAFGVGVVFFGFVYPGFSQGFSWWGTEVYKAGCDWQACPYKTLPAGGTFGPRVW